MKMERRTRRNSDPTPKPPHAQSNTEDDPSDRDMSTSFAGTSSRPDQPTHTFHKGSLLRGVDVPSAQMPHPPSVMSSSLPMTSPSSGNFLDRITSVESRSPYLERMSRDKRLKNECGGKGERGVSGEDEVLVSRSRRSGKGRKKRRKREEATEHIDTEVTTAGGDRSSPTSLRIHKQDETKHHQSHVTQRQGHVTAHVIQGEGVRNSIPHQFIGTDECDFETEPKGSIIHPHSPSDHEGDLHRGVGGDRGSMSLEMELALATKDIQPQGGVAMDRSLPRINIETETATGDGGRHQLEQPHSLSDVSPFEEIGEEDSQSSIPPSAANPFGDEETLNDRQQKCTRNTAPVHSRRVQHPKLKMKVEQDVDKHKSKSSSQKKLDSQIAREASPNYEGDFDVITNAEVTEVFGGRARSTTDYKKAGEERQRERGSNASGVTAATEGS